MKKVVIGLCFLFVGLFWSQIWERIPDLLVIPENPAVVEIEKPDNVNILDKTSSIASLVTEDEDKVRLAIFNDVFASRVLEYNATAQQINDVYTQAAKYIFGSTMTGKYPGFGRGITDLLEEVLGSEGQDDYQISQEQKEKLSETFRALAWNFVN